MRKWILFSILAMVAILNTVIPGIASAESGFAVGPAQLDVTVSENGSSPAYVYVTSYLDGELVVGTENLPFHVEPETIPITATDRNRKVELVVHGDTSLTKGQYSGKLTFLLYTGSNVAYGVKINTNITQESNPVTQESEPSGIVAEITDIATQNYIIIIVVVGVLVALALGIFIGRKSKENV
jgi:hypothetical protein